MSSSAAPASLLTARAAFSRAAAAVSCSNTCARDSSIAAVRGLSRSFSWALLNAHGAAVPGRDALEGKVPQRRPRERSDRRLEEVAKAVWGGYCRLQMPLSLALAVRGTVAGRRLGALEGGGGGVAYLPSNAPLVPGAAAGGGGGVPACGGRGPSALDAPTAEHGNAGRATPVAVGASPGEWGSGEGSGVAPGAKGLRRDPP